jgi:hypothetical protein
MLQISSKVPIKQPQHQRISSDPVVVGDLNHMIRHSDAAKHVNIDLRSNMQAQ